MALSISRHGWKKGEENAERTHYWESVNSEDVKKLRIGYKGKRWANTLLFIFTSHYKKRMRTSELILLKSSLELGNETSKVTVSMTDSLSAQVTPAALTPPPRGQYTYPFLLHCWMEISVPTQWVPLRTTASASGFPNQYAVSWIPQHRQKNYLQVKMLLNNKSVLNQTFSLMRWSIVWVVYS